LRNHDERRPGIEIAYAFLRETISKLLDTAHAINVH
jgi:hypothetical protein